jgi:hypothetical protein
MAVICAMEGELKACMVELYRVERISECILKWWAQLMDKYDVGAWN